MRKSEEFAAKLERLDRFLVEQELGGVVLSRSENFAWLGCGADNSVVISSETGVAALVARPGCVTLVANNIEADRMLTEELGDLEITETEVFPWHQPAERDRVISRLSTGARVVADDGSAGLPPLPEEFDRLRYVLTGAEIDRYQELGQDCTEAMEAAARSVERGMAEVEVAGLLADALRKRA
ncbi:MAG: aminopeptidase P family N-terminal domain-containing protein, partial [Candidatus Brocadiaceae bacterium]